MSHWEYLKTRFKLAFTQTFETFGKTITTVILGAAILGLTGFFYWRDNGWPTAAEELVNALKYSIRPSLWVFSVVFGWHFFFNTPYSLHKQLSDRLARTSDIRISQLTGVQKNVRSMYQNPQEGYILIRDVVLVNNSDKDDVVSLQLRWRLESNHVLHFSPETTAPENVWTRLNMGTIPLLNGAENIPSRRSITGSLLFRIPTYALPNISALPFFVLSVTSQLSEVTHAYNTLDFTEVMEPYPRTFEELSDQAKSSML